MCMSMNHDDDHAGRARRRDKEMKVTAGSFASIARWWIFSSFSWTCPVLLSGSLSSSSSLALSLPCRLAVIHSAKCMFPFPYSVTRGFKISSSFGLLSHFCHTRNAFIFFSALLDKSLLSSSDATVGYHLRKTELFINEIMTCFAIPS